MKKLFFLIPLLFSVATFAQTTKSNPTPLAQYGQMLVSGKTYTGTYLDTTTTGTLYLYSCKGSNGSLKQSPTYGYHKGTVTVNVLKISGTPAGTLSLESSPDSLHWGAACYFTGGYVDTFQITNVSTLQTKKFIIDGIVEPYIRVNATGRGTYSMSVNGFYWFDGQK